MAVNPEREHENQELLRQEQGLSSFVSRHIGPDEAQIEIMLKALGQDTLEGFISQVVPSNIRASGSFTLSGFNQGLEEEQALKRLAAQAANNQIFRSYIGMGYYATLTPAVIARNILENPGWYTQYTPYQAEISQGRLEALLNFQTMVAELCGLPVANASLLDEPTAAAEAMSMSFAARGNENKNKFFVASDCHPQTVSVVSTRAEAAGIEVVVEDHRTVALDESYFGALLQYPNTYGSIFDFSKFVSEAQAKNLLVTFASDLLALCLLKSPGSLGADICVGNSQRFGVPLGFGGPHAAFFATRDEFKRIVPGRIVGLSKDKNGRAAIRLALQTREQHIRREKATSNICTAQVLLAIMASMYAVYHGPVGLKGIATAVHRKTQWLAQVVKDSGLKVLNSNFFDTLRINGTEDQIKALTQRAADMAINLRLIGSSSVGVSLDEATSVSELEALALSISGREIKYSEPQGAYSFEDSFTRQDSYLKEDVFNSHHSETQFLRYIKKLEAKDLSLAFSMIPLGSCTMKLNATSEMLPVSWPEFSKIHPYAPAEQWRGYQEMFNELETVLAEITGFDSVSLQPNAGSQGEYAGLLAIRAYHKSRGESARNICLIPKSAHGTNPASAIMAGMKVVVVGCDDKGNIDLADLRSKIEANQDKVSALMVTYPSTHGVFEDSIKQVCALVHQAGGQVYLDGANLNALVGICKPAEFGVDVCHFNLHKTFCIPHGGGGPGMGPIAVSKHLAKFLPIDPLKGRDPNSAGAVSAAMFGSASILPISWMYIAMMGAEGLKKASSVAILNANYIASRLKAYFPLLYSGQGDFVAHECVLDLRELKKSAGIEVEDVAKRLIDYGFHAPTVSWPVPGTLMIEPTESESLAEMDRFCEAMIAIWQEAQAVSRGEMDKDNNPLKNAPHTAYEVISDEWNRPYTREQAAFPLPYTRERKFWPAVSRIDNAYGDRNLVCTCAPLSDFE